VVALRAFYLAQLRDHHSHTLPLAWTHPAECP
jgi:hypothetical protein